MDFANKRGVICVLSLLEKSKTSQQSKTPQPSPGPLQERATSTSPARDTLGKADGGRGEGFHCGGESLSGGRPLSPHSPAPAIIYIFLEQSVKSSL